MFQWYIQSTCLYWFIIVCGHVTLDMLRSYTVRGKNAVVITTRLLKFCYLLFFSSIISPKTGVGMPNPPDTSMICPVV